MFPHPSYNSTEKCLPSSKELKKWPKIEFSSPPKKLPIQSLSTLFVARRKKKAAIDLNLPNKLLWNSLSPSESGLDGDQIYRIKKGMLLEWSQKKQTCSIVADTHCSHSCKFSIFPKKDHREESDGEERSNEDENCQWRGKRCPWYLYRKNIWAWKCDVTSKTFTHVLNTKNVFQW